MSRDGAPVRVCATIQGAVQGVGFRPFVYRLATEYGLVGYVSNTPQGVVVEAEGARDRLTAFVRDIQEKSPPLSIIESIDAEWAAPLGAERFEIRQSESQGDVRAHILPDIATCVDCLREIQDPADRRYRYPFTNCTHCGPRYSIIHRLPYDRPNTTMKVFEMCPECRAEYENPRDRRFHAQPTACPACGPHLALWSPDGRELETRDAALREAVAVLIAGKVLAVKGLGGFHLMVDARSEDAVCRLRRFKHREEKPFALMYPGVERIREDCIVSELALQLLESPESPIVLLDRVPGGTSLAPSVAPGAPRFGIMLPYTPLHHVLMEELGFPIVATSGNLSEEPICIDEHEALERLRGIAEFFLVHNRPIARHVDDSIIQIVMGREMVLRRARGYAPLPVNAKEPGPVVLAVGGHLKNTVAVAKEGNVFLSQHIGDLETPQAFDAFTEAAQALQTLYEARPECVACDMHPDYLSAKHARELPIPRIEVQHHYAHVVACMAEHGLTEPVLGVSWDGTGYGPDGTIWGCEFLRATRGDFERIGRLRPFPLPGGRAALREPRRSALGLLFAALGPEALDNAEFACVRAFTPTERKNLVQLLVKGVNAPITSSAGRLFDAVASLTGLYQQCSFEGQAAMAVEYAARSYGNFAPRYTIEIREWGLGWELDWAPMLEQLLRDVSLGTAPGAIAAAFHVALAHAILGVAAKAGLENVVLTGGCFQNSLLSELAIRALRDHGFHVHWHRRVPPNDGGIALGQAVHALARARIEDRG